MHQTSEQEAFDAAKLGWASCKTKAELEEKIKVCVELAAKLSFFDTRHTYITIMQDALPNYQGPDFRPEGKHWIAKGDYVTDYKRMDRGKIARGVVIKIWRDQGHTESVDVKFAGPDTEYISYYWAQLKHRYRGSKQGYVVGD